jgi:hypothetical protein
MSDEFVIKLLVATLYVMIGGGLLAWVLNYIVDTVEELQTMTAEDVIGALFGVGVIIVVALLI